MDDLETFACFLSHNSADKPRVQALAEDLRARGISVWLDVERLRPGIPWQPLLEAGIRASRTVAVLVGNDGLGPWEAVEMRAALHLAVQDGRPVIPVLLADASTVPELPLFLVDRTWVDLRRADGDGSAAELDRLVWGITGLLPDQAPPHLASELSSPAPDEDHDYQTRLESALARFLDHQRQLVGVADLRADRADRVLIGVVECSAEDWPSYLAHHLQCAQATDPADAILGEAIELNLRRRGDPRAVWCALVETANAVSAPSPDAQRSSVRALLAGPGLRVLYAHVDVRLHGRHLAALIAGAADDLRALGEVGADTRVLLLIGAGRDPGRPPFWWRWRHRHAVRRLDCCHALAPMAPLGGEDVEGWYQDFPTLLRHCLDRDRIKTELLDLFALHGAVRYQRVRKLLLGDGAADPGALRRARLRPCNR